MKSPALVLSFVTSVLLTLGIAAVADAQQPVPPNAKFRGKSLEQWSLLSTEWQIATGLGRVTDLTDTVNGVRFLPGSFQSSELDIVLTAGTPFVSSSWFVFGELYDDLSSDNPEDPIIDFILETAEVETTLNGQVIISGNAAQLDELMFGPAYFEEPIFYAEPQPRGENLNSVAALFVFGIGAVYHPLPVGEHTLVTEVDSLFFGQSTTTYHITVVPKSHP